MLNPYINLAEKLGLFTGQILEGRLFKVNIEYNGEITKMDCSPLTLSLLKGLLTPSLRETVNFVNALTLAKERGIKVSQVKSTQSEEFANLITITAETDKDNHCVSGTLFTNKEMRIVKLDDFYIEAIPKGPMLIINNLDKPGIIGNLGMLLGKHDINIAGMNFGRKTPGGNSITVLNVDGPVSDDVLSRIKQLENILFVKMVKL